MNKKINYWKFATIILAIIFLFILIIYSFPSLYFGEDYNFNGFKISKNSFDSLANVHKGEENFPICSIKENRCIIMYGVG